jgi:hypothetical protein
MLRLKMVCIAWCKSPAFQKAAMARGSVSSKRLRIEAEKVGASDEVTKGGFQDEGLINSNLNHQIRPKTAQGRIVITP